MIFHAVSVLTARKAPKIEVSPRFLFPSSFYGCLSFLARKSNSQNGPQQNKIKKLTFWLNQWLSTLCRQTIVNKSTVTHWPTGEVYMIMRNIINKYNSSFITKQHFEKVRIRWNWLPEGGRCLAVCSHDLQWFGRIPTGQYWLHILRAQQMGQNTCWFYKKIILIQLHFYLLYR